MEINSRKITMLKIEYISANSICQCLFIIIKLKICLNRHYIDYKLTN